MRMAVAIALLLFPALARAQEVAEIDDQLRERPEDVGLRLDHAEALLALGRFDEALVDCDLATALAPKDASIALTRGRIQLAMGELGLAEAHFSSYLKHGQPTIEVFMMRGAIREETERDREALADYDAARRLALSGPKQRRMLGDMLELIDIEAARARTLERLGRAREAHIAREHVVQLRAWVAAARPRTDS